MNRARKTLDTSSELFIVRSGAGIKLLPDVQKKNLVNNRIYHRVSDVLGFAFNSYFLDTESRLQNASRPCLDCIGMDSLKKSIGLNAYDLSLKRSAMEVIKTDREILLRNTSKIVEENAILNNGAELNFLTIKVPWYDNAGNTIGLFGCSILIGQHSLANALLQIKQLGMLDDHINSLSSTQSSLGQYINGIYLTKKETELLYYLIRGKTAKQIAKVYGISFRTIEERIHHVKNKFGVSCKGALIELVVDSLLN
ncbi:hypothetical protein AYO45_02245 [Gammaproteobacteria bacterium SCGC AG-212-F23]|nr:hypothetical protein AYO45_02245 [Gammaproteobacteria bacterium SCGC AG-212-F23]